ncbi:MAG: hypothetical protein KatS3mg131_0932 [Candidatus Tectimicrobiota bacterium]|nr:MAG: hypothetical protein KatS3mg131_0932 [Candidatus Tectomicrobia bacterium]
MIGLAAGYTTTDVDLDATAGNLDVEGWSVSGPYGTYQTPAGLYVDGIVTLGWNDYEMTRRIDYRFTDRTGASRRVNQTALGETAGRWYAASVGLGYDWQRRAWTLGPLLRVSYTRVDIDGFTEAVVFNPGNTEVGQHLTIDGQDLESLTTAVGVQMAYALSTPLGVLLPQAQLEWEHEFENDSRTLVARYVGDPGATPLRLRTDAPDRDFFNLGVGLTATLPLRHFGLCALPDGP